MKKVLEIRCGNCGKIYEEIETQVSHLTNYRCNNCKNHLLSINPGDDEHTIFANILLHDKSITGMMDGANKVIPSRKGDFCGDGLVLYLICRFVTTPRDSFYFRSLKLLEQFNYNFNEIGNFYRWYIGVSINSEGKVTNKSDFGTRFIVGQVANHIFPGASIALSIMNLFDNSFEKSKIHYEKYYRRFEKRLPKIKSYDKAPASLEEFLVVLKKIILVKEEMK